MLLFLSLVLADEPKVVYKKETTIDFEAAEVEGQIKKPHGVISMERAKAQFNPLVYLRTDFFPEMENSLKEIQ